MNIAAILAGGTGVRFGGDIPKQFISLAGKTLIEYSIEAFQQHPLIDEIVIVVPSMYISKCEKYKQNYSKLQKIVAGGKERYHSTLAVLSAYKTYKEANIILHDGVRPLITQQMINDVVSALHKYNAATLAVKTTDTIIQSSENNVVNGILDRSALWNVQTPQAFKLSVLQQAFELALKDSNFHATDDSAVVFNYLKSEKIAIVEGDVSHIKLTYPSDVLYAEKLLLSKLKNNDVSFKNQ
ncbi:MAG: 2-C-methyl-D-erythritol 4-phosphate cytidylyltransferase [Bacteroidales bacterium]|nr:2-C-methyl-D-erythritol 4-phosphate cytidylyltransferase [Bacteroidales bacterium]